MYIYVVVGDYIWIITAYAENRAIFEEDRQAINNILSSIRFVE
jgi:hypothetical protein